ncbi:MAG TPA: TraB/GumN family protein [Saprospiraceae bacterium]|nr:TraB/GumN family protein [Saprospiraceae bacterium]
MIFSITHPQSGRTSYLMGTMHSQDGRAFRYFETAQNLISACEMYAPEMNLLEVDTHRLKEAFTLPPELYLDRVWRPKKYQRYRDICLKCFGIDLAGLNDSAPIYIQGMMMAVSLGRENNISLDQALLFYARDCGLLIQGVETPEEQYHIARQLDAEEQIRQLSMVLSRPDRFRQQANRLCDLYANNELAALYKSGKRSLGAFRQILLYDRNQVMAQRIFEKTGDKKVFVAIGAAHLPGAKGVLRGLKQLGCMIGPAHSY